MKEIFEVIADDGAEQIFSAEEIGLDMEKDYTLGEVLKALGSAGYSSLGLVTIEGEDVRTYLAAAALGRKGGSVKSEAKAKAVAENGKLGGRPRKVQTGQWTKAQLWDEIVRLRDVDSTTGENIPAKTVHVSGLGPVRIMSNAPNSGWSITVVNEGHRPVVKKDCEE